MRWQIITGEYPPQIGGISDYTRQAARGLAAAGDQIDIWTGPGTHESPRDAGIAVHRLPDHFGKRSFAALDKALFALAPSDRRLLVQFEPWSFSPRGMNLALGFWLWRRGRAFNLAVMFHEVATDWGWRLRPRQNVLGAMTRLNAALAVRGARRAFVSIPAWEKLLRPMAGPAKPIEWLPVSSNLPASAPEGAAELRAKLSDGGRTQLVGHFGTFGGHVGGAMSKILAVIVRKNVRAVLVGRGAAAFRASLPEEVAQNVIAADSLDAADAAVHLAACDALVQPYPDGVSARRSSAMAGLGLGCAVVTNGGALSEPFWATCGAVRFVPRPDPTEIATAVNDLLANPEEGQRLREAAARYYAENFSPARTIATLRQSMSA